MVNRPDPSPVLMVLQRATTVTAWALLALAAICCQPPLPQAQRCDRDDDCPSGYVCHSVAKVCEPTTLMTRDAAVADLGPTDAPLADLAVDDRGAPDAALQDGSTTERGQLDAAMPDLLVPDGWEPDLLVPDGWEPDLLVPDGWEPDLLVPDGWEPDQALADTSLPDSSAVDLTLPDSCQPVDGIWGDWDEWSTCSSACQRERTRQCDSPAPACGGADCAGPSLESEACTDGACPSLTWGGSKTEEHCRQAGGTVFDTGAGTLCRFSSNSCPASWAQAANWQRYSPSSWGGDVCGNWLSTGPGSFANTQATVRGPGSYNGCRSTLPSCATTEEWYSFFALCNPPEETYNRAPVVETFENVSTNRVDIGCI